MKWLRQSRNIDFEELKLLEESLQDFYRDPPDSYHEEAAAVNADWSDSDHIFHRKITDLVNHSAKVLDIGCGPAMACPFFLEKGADYTGVELSKKQVEINRRNYPQCDFHSMHWRDIPKLGEIYDLVTSFFVLEHIVFPREFLQISSRCVKTGGFIAVLCPHFLKRGFLPSQHLFGRKPGGIKAKIKQFHWIEAVIEIFDRYVLYPLLIKKARKTSKKEGTWLINLRPLCLENKSWVRDWDAVYMVSEDEVADHIESLGFKIFQRGDILRSSSESGTYPDFCYVIGEKI